MKILIALFPLLLVSCSTTTEKKMSPRLSLHEFPERVKEGIKLQAFSGLFFEMKTAEGELVFWTHSDRGPNAEAYAMADKRQARPFVWPDYSPTVTQFKLNPATGGITYLQEITLKRTATTGMSGLPNSLTDEVPVDTSGAVLKRDWLGIDPESICIIDQHIWMVEEYGPSILKFKLDGKLVRRFVPQGYQGPKSALVKTVLPAEIRERQLNRGFEGMTCQGDTIFAALQSPLAQDGQNIRILQFNSKKEQLVGTHLYPLESMSADKIGDLSWYKDELLVLEQNSKTGPESFHRVYSFNLQTRKKTLFVDLVKEGYHFADKIEGMTIADGYLVIVNDNDFGLTGEIDATQKAKVDPGKKSVLGLIKLAP